MPGRKMAAFPWPIELSGRGEYRRKDGTYVIRYPRGDVFLSYVTLIHELGHPRQHERNPSLKEEGPQTHENLQAEEMDAWDRGWERFSRSNPDVMETLARRFEACRREGRIKEFRDFHELFAWTRDQVLRFVSVQRLLFEGGTEQEGDEAFDRLAEAMESQGLRAFLEKLLAQKVGDVIDDGEAEAAIRSCLEDIEKGG